MPEDAVVLVALAGLRAVKRPVWLLERLARLREQIAYLHGGPAIEEAEAARFSALAERHAWAWHVGVVPHGEVDSFLRAGDIYVSASRSEGMPHAAREAMLVGLPLLLSDNDGHRSMAREDVEALFFRDESSFAEAASRLVGDAELRQRLGRIPCCVHRPH